jgi:hypothetical protein
MYAPPKLNQEYINNLERSITIMRFNSNKESSTKKSPVPVPARFTAEFYQLFLHFPLVPFPF